MSGRRAFVGVLVGLGVLAAAGCGVGAGEESAPALRDRGGDVFRIALADARHPRRVVQTEWVQPSTGSWRIVEPDGRYKVSSPGRYAVVDSLHAQVEVGSARFLGDLRRLSVSLRPLRAYLAGEAGAAGVSARSLAGGRVELRFRAGHALAVGVVRRVRSAAEAEQRGLFDVPEEKVTARFVERRPGEPPAQAFTAYWFGPALGSRRPVAAAERSIDVTPELLATGGWSAKDEAKTYEVFYELPSAGGSSSVFAGEDIPAGEIQIVSQPLDLPIARAALTRFGGEDGSAPWPRTAIRLADGTAATVVPDRSEDTGERRGSFYVVTGSTLVSVVGNFQVEAIPGLARRLRPVG